MSSQGLSKRKSLDGKRILIVERDGELFRAITSAVRRAGCVVVGIEAHPEAYLWSPNRAVDAAIVDIDKGNPTLILLIEYLTDRAIPILLIIDAKQSLPANLHAHHQVRRSFAEAQLLHEVARV
jgi:hypothetical protein